MKIIVDNREHAFIDICRSKIGAFPHLEMEVAPLELGDMEIHYNDELLLVWERKTFSDLLSSIRDGRYTEQGHRLIHTHGPSKVVYLLEGIMSSLNLTDRKMVLSTMTSLSFHKQFHVWRSVNTHDSVDTLLTVCDKLYRDYQKGKRLHSEPAAYCEVVKKQKKANITRENIGEMLLCQIPDISSASAQALMEHVNHDFSQLLSVLRERPEELALIKIGGPKPRKLSKKVLMQLHAFLGPLSAQDVKIEDVEQENPTEQG